MNKIIFCVFALFLFVKGAHSQDTLRMLNGNVWIVKIGKITENEISFIPTENDKRELIVREKRNVFSLTRKGEKEQLFYKFDPEVRNFYKVDEMRSYMLGEREAQSYYKSNMSNMIAIAGGLYAGYLVSEGTVFAAGMPLVVSSIVIIPGVKVKKNDRNAAYYKSDDPYRDGYRRVAGSKKFLHSLKYGAISMLGSFLLFEVID